MGRISASPPLPPPPHTLTHTQKEPLKGPPTLGLNSLKSKANDLDFSKLKTVPIDWKNQVMWLTNMFLKILKYKTDKEGLDEK